MHVPRLRELLDERRENGDEPTYDVPLTREAIAANRRANARGVEQLLDEMRERHGAGGTERDGVRLWPPSRKTLNAALSVYTEGLLVPEVSNGVLYQDLVSSQRE